MSTSTKKSPLKASPLFVRADPALRAVVKRLCQNATKITGEHQGVSDVVRAAVMEKAERDLARPPPK